MKILFICTHNRCRSILAEAITNHLSGDRITAVSAGSSPEGDVHPLSLKYLAERNIKTDGLRSQSWHGFENLSPDAILTMCDTTKAETCPVWFDNSIQVHWGLIDPSQNSRCEEQQRSMFTRTMDIIEGRIRCLLESDLPQLSPAALQQELSQIALRIN